MRRFLVALLLALCTSSAFGISGDGGTVLLVQNGRVAIAGTSGGIPFFASASTLGTSAALTANGVVFGGGAGVSPGVTAAGTTGTVLKGNTGSAPTFAAVGLTTDVTGVLPLANGGTNANLTAANGQVAYSTATAIALTTSGSTGQCLKFNSGAAPSWATCGGVVPLIAVSTNGDITQATTMWMSISGATDISEARVQTPVVNAAGFSNLKCVSSVLPGASQTYTVTQTNGVCTGALTASTNQVCAIDNTTRIGCTTPATVAEVVSAGNCVAWKAVSSATAATGAVACTVERVS